MQLSVNHTNPKDKMLECSKKLLDQLKEQHKGRISHVTQIWTGYDSKFSFRISNFNVEGTICVKEDKLEINGRLPLAARLFKGMIEDTIIKSMKQLVIDCKNKH